VVGVGNIVSVGGTGGGSGGSTSGIQTINAEDGPSITFLGVNGISVTVSSADTILLDGISLSGVTTQSGVVGVNGITVEQAGGNFVVNGASLSGMSGGSTSGLCYSASFSDITSSTIEHNLGTTNVVANVFNASDEQMIPDSLTIVDLNNVSLSFNSPQSGKVVIVACGGNDSNLCEAKRYALLVS